MNVSHLIKSAGKTVIATALLGVAFVIPAQSQSIQRIAAIVNDAVISAYDLEQRVNLVIRTSNAKVNDEEMRRLRAQILQTLVDEKLQAQAANKFEVSPDEEDIKKSYARIAQQNGLEPDGLTDFFKEIDVDIGTLNQQLRTDASWRELVMRRYSSQVKIGEEEVREVRERLIRNQGKPENQISEIFLSVDSPDQEANIKTGAGRLVEQLRRGAPFAAVARQFSQSSSAAVGGSVGWIQSGEFAPEVENAIALMTPGQISDPIPSRGGYFIIKLESRREVFGSDPMQTLFGLRQLVARHDELKSPEEIDALARKMMDVARRTDGCVEEQMKAAAAEMNSPTSGQIPKMRAADLPELFRTAAFKTEVGKHTNILRGPKAFHVLYVCEREDAQQALPTEDQIADRLFEEEMSMLARRYLRDLRRDATIEYR